MVPGTRKNAALDILWGRLTIGTLAFVVQNEVAAPNRQDHGQEEEASSKT